MRQDNHWQTTVDKCVGGNENTDGMRMWRKGQIIDTFPLLFFMEFWIIDGPEDRNPYGRKKDEHYEIRYTRRTLLTDGIKDNRYR
jgi:hypothetical protein